MIRIKSPVFTLCVCVSVCVPCGKGLGMEWAELEKRSQPIPRLGLVPKVKGRDLGKRLFFD